MAQEGSEASVTSTSSNPNWWDMPHVNPALWSHMASSWQLHHNPDAAREDDMPASAANSLITNATSNHSGVSVDESSEHADTQLWSLLGVGNTAVGGDRKFPQTLSSKSLAAAGMFEPACDYLKKLDAGSWEFPSSSGPFVGKQQDMAGSWSIAPPQRELEGLRIEAPDSSSSSSYLAGPGMLPPCYEEVQQRQGGAPQQQLRQLGDGVGYHVGLRDPYGGMAGVQEAAAWSSAAATRNFSDLISFGSSMSKAMVVSNKPCARGLEVVDSRKQLGQHESPSIPGRRHVKGVGEGKNKRFDETSDINNSLTKKPKHETSKLQLPKVKVADKITALQQLVAPFGKTDTASVLLEAINYIRFLHEQVQLLSDPYMKSGVNKDHTSWGGLERKEVGERKVDLSSRGLCLVPVSCTPQVYRENTGPDYWTPTYRGCLYR